MRCGILGGDSSQHDDVYDDVIVKGRKKFFFSSTEVGDDAARSMAVPIAVEPSGGLCFSTSSRLVVSHRPTLYVETVR